MATLTVDSSTIWFPPAKLYFKIHLSSLRAGPHRVGVGPVGRGAPLPPPHVLERVLPHLGHTHLHLGHHQRRAVHAHAQLHKVSLFPHPDNHFSNAVPWIREVYCKTRASK